MYCPNCNSSRTRVVDTLPGVANNIFRRRKCSDCGTLFRSVELVLDNSEDSRDSFSAAQKQRNRRGEGRNV